MIHEMPSGRRNQSMGMPPALFLAYVHMTVTLAVSAGAARSLAVECQACLTYP